MVRIPILSGPLLITYTSRVFLPTWGTLNSVTLGVLPTSNLLAPLFLTKVTFCPVLNGWFGTCIVLVGIDKSFTTSPTKYFTLVAPPLVVPTPTDWGPLKYTKSFVLDSNFLVFTGILIWLFNTSITDPEVWAIPIPPPSFLCTFITFCVR